MKPKITDKAEFAALHEVKQAEYAPQEDGTWMLKIESVDGLALGKIETMLKTIDTERKAREVAEKQLGSFVGEDGKPLDAAKSREAMKKVAEMSTWKPEDKVREQIAHLKAEMEDGYSAERKELQEKATRLERGLTDAIVDSAIMSGIAGTKADPMIAQVVRSMIRPEWDEATKRYVPRVYDDAGNLRYYVKDASQTTRPLTPTERFEELKADPKYGIFFPGTGASGTGGTSPGKGAATGKVQITRSDSKDHSKWKAAEKQAEEAKVPLEVVDG